MDDEVGNMNQSGTDIVIGEELYGVSLGELRERITILQSEIARTQAELEKKQTERAAADQLFGTRS